MAPKKTSKAAAKSSGPGIGGLLAMLAILLGFLTPLFYMLEANLDKFYVFTPEGLHAVAKAGVEKHGNDTRAIVDYIVGELRADEKVAPYVSTSEEWFFNNAGGAMGGMYIIHASEFSSHCMHCYTSAAIWADMSGYSARQACPARSFMLV